MTLRTAMEANLDFTKDQKYWLNQLNELDEKQAVVVHNTSVIQQQCSRLHDRLLKRRCSGRRLGFIIGLTIQGL